MIPVIPFTYPPGLPQQQNPFSFQKTLSQKLQKIASYFDYEDEKKCLKLIKSIALFISALPKPQKFAEELSFACSLTKTVITPITDVLKALEVFKASGALLNPAPAPYLKTAKNVATLVVSSMQWVKFGAEKFNLYQLGQCSLKIGNVSFLVTFGMAMNSVDLIKSFLCIAISMGTLSDLSQQEEKVQEKHDFWDCALFSSNHLKMIAEQKKLIVQGKFVEASTLARKINGPLFQSLQKASRDYENNPTSENLKAFTTADTTRKQAIEELHKKFNVTKMGKLQREQVLWDRVSKSGDCQDPELVAKRTEKLKKYPIKQLHIDWKKSTEKLNIGLNTAVAVLLVAMLILTGLKIIAGFGLLISSIGMVVTCYSIAIIIHNRRKKALPSLSSPPAA